MFMINQLLPSYLVLFSKSHIKSALRYISQLQVVHKVVNAIQPINRSLSTRIFIDWIVIYSVDSTIQLLNNCGQL